MVAAGGEEQRARVGGHQLEPEPVGVERAGGVEVADVQVHVAHAQARRRHRRRAPRRRSSRAGRRGRARACTSRPARRRRPAAARPRAAGRRRARSRGRRGRAGRSPPRRRGRRRRRGACGSRRAAGARGRAPRAWGTAARSGTGRRAPAGPGAGLLVQHEQVLAAGAERRDAVLAAVLAQPEGVLVEADRAVEIGDARCAAPRRRLSGSARHRRRAAKKLDQQRRALLAQEPAGDLRPVVEARLGEHVEHAAGRARLRVRRAVDDARDAARARSPRRTSRTARASRRASLSRIRQLPEPPRRPRAARAPRRARSGPGAARARCGRRRSPRRRATTTAPTGTSSCSSARSRLAHREAHEVLVAAEPVRIGSSVAERTRFEVVRKLPSADNVLRVPARLLDPAPACSAARPPRRPGWPCSLRPRARPTTCRARSSSASADAPRGRDGGAGRRPAHASGPDRAGSTRGARRSPGCARRPGVLSATPNYIARAASSPTTPGRDGAPGGWQALQWNFAGAVRRQRAGRLGQPGARRAARRRAASSIAVLDTGVAYADRGRFTRSPDLRGNRFAPRPRLRRRRPLPERPQRPRHARRLHDRRDDRQRHRRHRARLRRDGSCPCACSTAGGEGDSAAISRGHPLRGAQAAPTSSTSRSSSAPTVARAGRSPTSSTRCASRAARACSSSAPRGNAARASVAYPARAARRALRRRHDRARLPRRLLEQRAARSTSSPPAAGPTRRSRATRTAARSSSPGRDIVQMTFTLQPRARSACRRLHGHVDGRAARVRDRGAGDRLRRDRRRTRARPRSRPG